MLLSPKIQRTFVGYQSSSESEEEGIISTKPVDELYKKKKLETLVS